MRLWTARLRLGQDSPLRPRSHSPTAPGMHRQRYVEVNGLDRNPDISSCPSRQERRRRGRVPQYRVQKSRRNWVASLAISASCCTRLLRIRISPVTVRVLPPVSASGRVRGTETALLGRALLLRIECCAIVALGKASVKNTSLG